MGHIWSLGQILEKPCVHSIGHISSPINLKNLVKMFVLIISWIRSKRDHIWSESRPNLRKTLCAL